MNTHGESVGAPDFGPPWYVSAIPAGPPAAPTGLAATGGNQSVTLSWNNPGDDSIIQATSTTSTTTPPAPATSPAGAPGRTVSNSGKDTTGHTFTGLTNGREYRYHLRAVNNIGPSVGAPADGPPWFASATPTSPDPDPPTNLRVERVCDHKLKVRWHRSAGATGYDLEIGSANGKHWKRLLTNWPGNSWYATNWQKDRTYRFAVRAVNEGGTSEWVNSALSVAPPCAVDNLRVTTSTPGEGDLGASGGSITASWNAGKRANAYHLELNGTRILNAADVTTHNWDVGIRGTNDTVSVQSVNGGMGSEWRSADVAWLTASNVAGTTATLNLAGHSGDWYVKQTAPTPVGSCESAGSGATHNLSNLNPSTAHSFTAYSDSGCANAVAVTTFITGADLIAKHVGSDSATLELEGHTEAWYYKANTGPDSGSCKGPVAGGTYTKDLAGLTAGTEYTYTAYSDSGCNTKLAAVTFTTGVTLDVSSVTDTAATLEIHGYTGSWYYQATSGPDTSCSSEQTGTSDGLTGLTAGTEYTYTAYSDNGCTATLTDAFKFTTSSLTAGQITDIAATLTISHHDITHHNANWYVKKTAPSPVGSCSTAISGTTYDLSSLTAGTEYTYKAYGDSNCASEIASETFTTSNVTVSNLGETYNNSNCWVGSLYGAFRICGAGFTTGTATNGYTLDSVTTNFGPRAGNPASLTVALHAASGNKPASAAIDSATFSGNESPGTEGEYTYGCSGDGCQLSANKTYYLVIGTTNAGDGNYYLWRLTDSDNETTSPSNKVWYISDTIWAAGSIGSDFTLEVAAAAKFKVSATVNP